MRPLILVLVLLIIAGACAADSISDAAGIVRVFGDASSWISTCFVIGDGSWVVTTADSITEKTSPDSSQVINYPVFISRYTGQAYQCELKAHDKDLNIALLKLPITGLPAAPFAQAADFSKAGFGTMGQLTTGDPIGAPWPTDIYGITLSRDKEKKLIVDRWNAEKSFICDMGNYKWLFLIGVQPDNPIPNGSMIARPSGIVGMYLNKLTVTGGAQNTVFGRCAISTEMARYLTGHGVSASTLYDPPKPTITGPEDADAAFQLQSRVYSAISVNKAGSVLEAAKALTKARPNDAQSLLVLGIAQTASGKPEDALKTYDEAAKLDPKLGTLHTNRALTLLSLKKTTEAEAELLKAADEAPSDVRPAAALANFYLGNDEALDKAVTWAKKAVVMAPDSPAARLLLARTLKSKKDYPTAINTIAGAIKIAPDWCDAWYALGSTYEEAGDKQNAEKAYRKLVEKQPRNPNSYLTLASFLIDQGQKDEPTELLNKLRDLKPLKDILDAAQVLQDKIDGKKPAEEKTE